MAKNLDMDCLRTFVTIVDVGSFVEAARRVGRTASAVSLQIGRLEDQVGAKLFRKVGRRMVPSPEGDRLLITARQVLELNDQVVEALSHHDLSGEISIGAIQDIADGVLPSVLARFTQAHPGVRLTAKVDRSKALAEAVDNGMLDLAIAVHGWSDVRHKRIRRDKMVWLGASHFKLSDTDTVPLVVFEPPCGFRDAAINSLNSAGRDWQVVFTSPSLSGLRAAIEAGLGVTARTLDSFQGQLGPLSRSSRLPKLPSVDLALYARPNLTAPASRLYEIIVDEVQKSDLDRP